MKRIFKTLTSLMAVMAVLAVLLVAPAQAQVAYHNQGPWDRYSWQGYVGYTGTGPAVGAEGVCYDSQNSIVGIQIQADGNCYYGLTVSQSAGGATFTVYSVGADFNAIDGVDYDAWRFESNCECLCVIEDYFWTYNGCWPND